MKNYYFDLLVDQSYVTADSEEEANEMIRNLIANGVEFSIYEVEEER